MTVDQSGGEVGKINIREEVDHISDLLGGTLGVMLVHGSGGWAPKPHEDRTLAILRETLGLVHPELFQDTTSAHLTAPHRQSDIYALAQHNSVQPQSNWAGQTTP